MDDRLVGWVSAGVLATGMSVSMLTGSGLAFAEDAGADTATSSQAPASRADTSEAGKPSARMHLGPRRAERSATQHDDPAGEEDGRAVSRGRSAAVSEVPDVPDDDDAEIRHDDKQRDDEQDDKQVEPVPARVPAEVSRAAIADSSAVSQPRVRRHDRAEAERTETARFEPAAEAPAEKAYAAVGLPTARPTLLNVVGSAFWGLFDFATRLIDLPPTVPPGSTVTAGRSRLEIDCGDGYTTDADWYFPTDGEPEKFIYFQHGFPARAGFYNVTLRELAERNNAILVAPSITSNIFACDACAAGGEPMHVAVAQLFGGDRAALLASARAAGYDGTLPEQFVFTGQSAGASTAVGAARYYWQFAAADEKSNMVGVLLYDVSALGGARTGGALRNALDNLPVHIPVLNIAAEPNALNSQGSGNAAFTEKRPGQFNGVQLVGGAHSDAFRSSTLFGIPQFIVSVLFGASKPRNVEAVHVLTEGWLTDMYERRVYDPQTRTGIYGDPGAPGAVVVDIPTDKGLARGYVLPTQAVQSSPFDRLINAFFRLINVNLFAGCADFPDETSSALQKPRCNA
ncbi:hypothetical protein [Mycolicibacterium vaccae]|uniref:hypothetical protein n=1 Tax=Mycolicibacterium vaccae TaxID=1810 RepID=UPI003D070E66